MHTHLRDQELQEETPVVTKPESSPTPRQELAGWLVEQEERYAAMSPEDMPIAQMPPPP